MKIKLIIILSFSYLYSLGQAFTENIGTANGTTTVAANTFQNTSFSFTGTSDTRSTGASSGYVGASGGRNIFFTTTVGTSFQIAGINTSSLSNLALKLGHYKSTLTSSNELSIEVSSDGITYTPLNYTRPTGSGTAIWVLISPTGTIPSTPNLRIRFTQNSTATLFRIDDISLTGTVPAPDINLSGNLIPILTGDTTPTTADLTDYGNVTVGNNLGATFTIENLGPAVLNIDNITITGSSAFAFAPFYTIPTSISATPSSNPLSISFNPIVPGLQTATVTIISDDPDEANYVFTIQGNGVGIPCTPAVISTIYPASGATGTEVTINASSGNLTGATATFNGISATVLSSSISQLVVIVPAGASTGNLVVSDNQPCQVSTMFTVITKDVTSCQGTSISDLIIYEVHDEQSGSGGTITLFNGTSTTKLLSNYKIFRTSNQNDGLEIDYATLTGSIAPGALGILRVKVGTSCTPLATNGTINGGFNANDGIQLRDGTGTTVIDDVDAYVPAVGYYMKRNVAGFIPRPSFIATDWTTTTLASGVCAPGLGTTPIVSGGAITPNISAQPTVSVTCASTSATLSVTAIEGFIGGNTLAYNWFAIPPNTTNWTDLVATPLAGHTGANTASLVISPLLDGYQYYCQVRENTATCYIATVAVKVSTGTTTWNGVAPWTNGTPTLTKAAIINGPYNTATNGSFDACNVTVNLAKALTISANTYVNIQNGLVVNGTVLVQNNGSLIQINNTAVNSGNITVDRNATVNALDYVYWSAPVSGQSFATQFSTTPASLKWRWDADATNANGTQGNWIAHNTTMLDGVGYIAGNTASSTFTKSFTGAPHNGIYTPQIKRGFTLGNRKDNWNLLGNPYPSAISVYKFLDANPDLEGAVYVWKHGQAPTSTTSPFYQNFVANYYSNDYLTANNTGNTNDPTDYKIASGQGFMTVMKDGAAITSTTAVFNNGMRDKIFANNVFYRTTNAGTNSRNRIWLDLSSNTESSRCMFGYVANASNDFDDRFDALTNVGNGLKLFTTLNNDKLVIQGKALPFTDSDLVSLGLNIPTSGNYTIALSHVDGLFLNNEQTIYLEDKQLNIIHDLSRNPYTFTGTTGITTNRFLIRYTNTALSTSNFDAVANQLFVFGNQNIVKIESKISNIKSYTVFNVLGQILTSENNLNKNFIEITSLQKNNQALVVKVTLENDEVITKKIIF